MKFLITEHTTYHFKPSLIVNGKMPSGCLRATWRHWTKQIISTKYLSRTNLDSSYGNFIPYKPAVICTMQCIPWPSLYWLRLTKLADINQAHKLINWRVIATLSSKWTIGTGFHCRGILPYQFTSTDVHYILIYRAILHNVYTCEHSSSTGAV